MSDEVPRPCDYWYDCTLDLQDRERDPVTDGERAEHERGEYPHTSDPCPICYRDEEEEVQLLDYPTMSCRLEDGHEGPHQLQLDSEVYELARRYEAINDFVIAQSPAEAARAESFIEWLTREVADFAYAVGWEDEG